MKSRKELDLSFSGWDGDVSNKQKYHKALFYSFEVIMLKNEADILVYTMRVQYMGRELSKPPPLPAGRRRETKRSKELWR